LCPKLVVGHNIQYLRGVKKALRRGAERYKSFAINV